MDKQINNDPEAVANVTPVTNDTPAQQQASAPAVKQDLTATQVDNNPDSDVSLDDFIAVKAGISSAQKQLATKLEDKKADEIVAKPLVDDKKADDKVVESKQPEVRVDDKKVDAKVDDKESDKRVYDDLPEELKPIFKKLHNEPFNALKPIVKALAETKTKLAETESKLVDAKKGGLPDNYFEHSKGYILAPEFEQAANTAIRAEQIANHWKGQLDRIRKGEATYQEVVVNPRTGELSLSKPINVDKDAENEVASYVDFSQQQLMEKQIAVRSFAEKHATTHKESVSQVTDFEKTAFKVFDGDNSKAWEPIIKDTIAKTFPAAFRNNPLATGYAKALLTIDILGKQLTQLKAGGKVAETLKTDDGKVISKEDKLKAGPTNGDMANAGGGASKADDDDITIDAFKERINGGSVHMRR